MKYARKGLGILRRYGPGTLVARATSVTSRWARGRLEETRFALTRRLGTLYRGRPVAFATPTEQPLVSIVILACRDLGMTQRCLHALRYALDKIAVDVIVVDDGSDKRTSDYVARCVGVRIAKGPIDATMTLGKYIGLLDGDMFVHPGWLGELLRVCESDERIAAAGSQVRSRDGRVAEAGGIVWRDGSLSMYGRSLWPHNANVAFCRDVDYCSRASLLMRSDAFQRLGTFGSEALLGEYADADLCLGLQQAGYRVVYVPTSVATCLGVASDRTGEQRAAFERKWSTVLEAHCSSQHALSDLAARRLQGVRSMLVLDDVIPFQDRSAGGRRLYAIMKVMREQGWQVSFIPRDRTAYEPYASRLRGLGVEIRVDARDLVAEIARFPFHIDLAWVCRPDVMAQCATAIRHRAPDAALVYDTVDLHHVRLRREQETTGEATAWEAIREVELQQARDADAVVVTSSADREALSAFGIESSIIPIVEETIAPSAPWDARTSVLFLGNYAHAPNIDGALLLADVIMPIVWASNASLRLVLAGADPPPQIRRLASARVAVPGYIPDLRPLFERAVVFAAPLRFGAGMKGKVVQSLAHGVPVVTTAIGAEGIGITPASGVIAESPDEFADAVLHLAHDRDVWGALSGASVDLARQFSPLAVAPALQHVLESALDAAGRRANDQVTSTR